nr:hypothetical protein HK105_005799 [Polyrhizophydium stewartii]
MRVLELGAGTGLAGLVLARLGVASQVVLTDHPALDRVLGNLRDSVRLNGLDGAGVPSAGRADVLVRPLAWGDFATGEMADLVGESGFDVILGADVMYDPKDFEALLATVAFVLERSPPHAVFVTAYQERSSRRSVQALLDKWGLRARQVGPDPLEMRAWLESALQSEMSGALRGGDRAIMLDGLRFEPEDGVPLQAGLDSIFVFEIRRNNAPAIVAEFWEDVMKFAHEPASYTLGHPTDAHGGAVDRDAAPPGPRATPDDKTVRRLITGVIKAKREHGDIWPSLMTRQCCEFYESLDMPAKAKFLLVLAKEFSIDLQETAAAVQQFEDSLNKADRTILRASSRLRDALKPAYDILFARINQLPGGMRFLVNMRADILAILAEDGNNLHLRALNDSLKDRLQEWFGMGFVDLEQITWSSPASILEKIVQYEAVHKIVSWDDLKQRLGLARLCYAFFHRGIPQEPLTSVQVALVPTVSTSIQAILDDRPAEIRDPKVAIFYSISSSQPGLSGVNLGNFLIKRVVKEVQLNYPSITTFSTLSPIPGFRGWLRAAISIEAANPGKCAADPLLLPEEARALETLKPSAASALAALHDLAANTAWLESQDTVSVVRPILMRLCSRYLIHERKRMFALDPVANFHIRNGAAVYQLNWAGDTSPKGADQSFGIMVNYIYVLPEVESNNQKYLLDGRIAVWDDPVQPELAPARDAVAHRLFCPTTGLHRNIGGAVASLRMPGLVAFGQASRQLRRVSLMHPFWTELAWHRLLPRRAAAAGEAMRDVTGFFVAMAAEPARLQRVSAVHLDLHRWNVVADGEALARIVRHIRRPERVHTVVLSMRWDACGSPDLIEAVAARCTQCRRLFIQGGGHAVVRGAGRGPYGAHAGAVSHAPNGGALYGLSSAAVRQLAESMHHLTHLFIEGFGGASFSWRALLELLRGNPGITTLALGHVRDGVRLDVLSSTLPALEVLSVQFSIVLPPTVSTGHADLLPANHHEGVLFDHVLRSFRECVPSLFGEMAGFGALRVLAFHDSGDSEELSSQIILRLIDTLPRGKLMPPRQGLGSGPASSLRLLLA